MPPHPPASGSRFHQHRDYGLLRERPVGSLHYEAWLPDMEDTHMQGGYWHTIQLNPFTASMSPISEVEAEKIAGTQLHDQVDDEKYDERTRARLAEQGL